VLAAGGRITVELNEYPGGRRFMFADPWGNVLGIYEPSVACSQASSSGASMRSSSAIVVAQLRIVIDL
jgi:hypothetical protein